MKKNNKALTNPTGIAIVKKPSLALLLKISLLLDA